MEPRSEHAGLWTRIGNWWSGPARGALRGVVLLVLLVLIPGGTFIAAVVVAAGSMSPGATGRRRLLAPARDASSGWR